MELGVYQLKERSLQRIIIIKPSTGPPSLKQALPLPPPHSLSTTLLACCTPQARYSFSAIPTASNLIVRYAISLTKVSEESAGEATAAQTSRQPMSGKLMVRHGVRVDGPVVDNAGAETVGGGGSSLIQKNTIKTQIIGPRARRSRISPLD